MVYPTRDLVNYSNLLKKILPKDNELPTTTYEAKQLVCPLGLEVQKIHACPNDCILYRGEYENLDACPVGSALRYKIIKDDPGDVEGGASLEESSCEGHVVFAYNTTFEASV